MYPENRLGSYLRVTTRGDGAPEPAGGRAASPGCGPRQGTSLWAASGAARTRGTGPARSSARTPPPP